MPTYALGVPPVTPIRITAGVNENAWLASNEVARTGFIKKPDSITGYALA